MKGRRRQVGRASLALAIALAALAGVPGLAQAASPGWRVLAVTGPTHLPPRQSEVQRLTVEAEGGTFTLSHKSEGSGTLSYGEAYLSYTEGSPEATIAFGAGGFAPGQAVISAAGKVAPGAVVESVSGSVVTFSEAASSGGYGFTTAGGKEVTGVTGTFREGEPIEGEGIAAGTTVESVSGSTLTLSTFPNGGGTVDLSATETTDPPLSFAAPAAVVQRSLEELPAFGPGSVSVSGGPGGDAAHPYSIAFDGPPLVNEDVTELSADGSGLVGAHAAIHVRTMVPGGAGTGEIALFASNIGGADAVPGATVHLGPLPAGVVTTGPAKGSGGGWSCATAPSEVTCTSTEVVSALSPARPIDVPVEAQGPNPLTASVPVSISGGGATAPASFQLPIEVSEEPVKAGIQALWAGAFDEDGREFAQAGGHPYSAATAFLLNTRRLTSGTIAPVGDIKDVLIDLPPGFLGNPLITARCPQSLPVVPWVVGEGSEPPACNRAQNAIGEIEPNAGGFGGASNPFPIVNDVPVFGSLAQFATRVTQPVQSLIGSVRSEGDFGVRITAPHVAQISKLYGTFGVLWGRPPAAQGKAFLVYPTDCAQQRQERAEGRGPTTTITVSSWQPPSTPAGASVPQPLLTGCQALTNSWLGVGPEPKKPSFQFQPTTTNGSSGAGATARLHIPQGGLSPAEAPFERERLASSDLKKAVVTLPEGLTVNPSSANGLQACSEAQIGYLGSNFPSPNPIRFNKAAPNCPDGSKLGTLEATSPAVEEALPGTIYLAAQDENPFHSLLALYLVVESPRFGLTVKLAGEIHPDPNTGQLTATFDNNPQLPVEDLTLHFRGGGPHSELATPEVCGHYATTGALTPWSAEHGEAAPITEAGFDVSGHCASSAGARGFSPFFQAGTTGTQAGAYSPMVIKIGRNDGEQELTKLDFTLPLGLTAKLAGIPYCSDAQIATAAGKAGRAELASPSCPAASRIGSVDTAAGVGSEPFHVGGTVYLAGPYKGAPLSAVVVTPAVAGPFDLGTVVVRTPLQVNQRTAQITASSDPIPTILKGIPLKLRSVSIHIDRANFSLNPTDCEPMSVAATLYGSSGATAKPANRFQVGGCRKLRFKPRLKLRLKGATGRTGHPALKAVVTYPKKGRYANIARAQVGLPHAEFLDQGNLNKVCKQADLKAGTCPKKSIYGWAKAWTPLLSKPLHGPVYLGVGYGYKLPALVADLNGQVRLLLVGRIDTTKHNGIRSTFEVVPDAPVSRFVLRMKGGKKYGLLENSENICKKKQRASAMFNAQNGLRLHMRPRIHNSCKGKKHRRKKSRHSGSPRQGGKHRAARRRG